MVVAVLFVLVVSYVMLVLMVSVTLVLLYVLWCVGGDVGGDGDVCIGVYVCVGSVDCVYGGCVAADDGGVDVGGYAVCVVSC